MVTKSNTRDPEIRQLRIESLRLIVASEKVLTALEDHIALLRTFVSTSQHADDTADDNEHADERTDTEGKT